MREIGPHPPSAVLGGKKQGDNGDRGAVTRGNFTHKFALFMHFVGVCLCVYNESRVKCLWVSVLQCDGSLAGVQQQTATGCEL